MTTLCIDLDASAALRAELQAHLHGDPRTSEPDVPAPYLLERHRDLIAACYRAASPINPDHDMP